MILVIGPLRLMLVQLLILRACFAIWQQHEAIIPSEGKARTKVGAAQTEFGVCKILIASTIIIIRFYF